MLNFSEKTPLLVAIATASLLYSNSLQATEILTPSQMDNVTAGTVQPGTYLGALIDNEGSERESGRIKLRISQAPSSDDIVVTGKLRFYGARVVLKGKGTLDPETSEFQFSLKNKKGVVVGSVTGRILHEINVTPHGKGDWNVNTMNVGSGGGCFYLFRK